MRRHKQKQTHIKVKTQAYTQLIHIHCWYLLGNKKQLLKFMQKVKALIVSH